MEILRVEHVKKYFGTYAASNDISFTQESGKILGLIGPNGAGKTTMLRMITNILIPDEGSITLWGEPVTSLHQNRIGYLPEERGLYKKIKVIDQLIYFGQLKGLSRSDSQQKASFWLRRLDADDWANKKIQELSKGMQQKVQFISTILHNPDFLVLDEPFSGFDPINTDLMKKIILDMKAEGKTIILSTHVMEQAEQLCEEICMINKGKIVLSGSLRDAKKSYGRDTVLMEFDGDDSFLNNFQNIKYINRTQNRVEFRVSDSTLLKQILEKALESVEVYKYELMEPSLNEIFIDVATKQGEGEEN
jgi:ABC-2 type transport system ATP-binding protein